LAFLERASLQMQDLVWQIAPDMTKAMFKPGSILESISDRFQNFLYHIRFPRRSQVWIDRNRRRFIPITAWI
jgi:hypothetical protein